MKTKVLVLGGAGFIGHHLAKRLMSEGCHVVVADIKPYNEFSSYPNYCNEYFSLDLTRQYSWEEIYKLGKFDEVYQMAANMGGAGYVFTGNHDYDIMVDSSRININSLIYATKYGSKIFLSSSACIYPAYNQLDPTNPLCREDSAYPASPDSEYGWEKLFAERLFLAANRNLKHPVRIGRYHNIFGPEGTFAGGKEKAPAAICRKVIQADKEIEIWGLGDQTRSFLYIDECIEGTIRLMRSNFTGPVNIGSEEMISINDLAKMIIRISGKDISIKNISGPTGVRGRNSDNYLINKELGWKPSNKLEDGITKTYKWIESQLHTGC